MLLAEEAEADSWEIPDQNGSFHCNGSMENIIDGNCTLPGLITRGCFKP
jgi:hypothetical protein